MWLTKQMHRGTIIKPLNTAAPEESLHRRDSGLVTIETIDCRLPAIKKLITAVWTLKSKQ